MDHILTRFADQMIARVSGPMKFRFFLQPTMAAIFAIRSGLADARAGKPAYLWGLVSNPAERGQMLKDGWTGIRNVFILALVLDVIYQIAVLRFVYIGEALAVAFVLALVPYVTLRGLITRLARRGDVQHRAFHHSVGGTRH